jgi:hypothetical protein
MDRAKQVEKYVVKIFKDRYVHGDDYDWVEPECIFNIIFRDSPNFKIKIHEVEHACNELERKKILVSRNYENGLRYVWNRYQKKPVVKPNKTLDWL